MKKVISEVAQKVELPENIVLKLYKEYWRFIKSTIEELPLKDNLSEEDFSNLKTNFNLPYLGKLNCTYTNWIKKRNKYRYGNKYKKDTSNV